jgi:HSP20 family protein
MGIMDKVAALVPWRRERRELTPLPNETMSLRDDLDQWLHRLLEESWPLAGAGEVGWIPAANVHETEDEIVVTVEVPGLERDDLDLMIIPGGLVVRGEKHEVREEPWRGPRVTPEGLIVRDEPRASRRAIHVAECRYGSFVRTVPLPPDVDVDGARARVTNGVLVVRFPKLLARRGTHRIPIQT